MVSYLLYIFDALALPHGGDVDYFIVARFALYPRYYCLGRYARNLIGRFVIPPRSVKRSVDSWKAEKERHAACVLWALGPYTVGQPHVLITEGSPPWQMQNLIYLPRAPPRPNF